MDKIILQNALNSFKGKKVFITGHTGFKGSWLSYILNEVGAEVMGYALDPIDGPSHFNMLNLSSKINHVVGDVRDAAKLDDAMHKYHFHEVSQEYLSMQPYLLFVLLLSSLHTKLNLAEEYQYHIL